MSTLALLCWGPAPSLLPACHGDAASSMMQQGQHPSGMLIQLQPTWQGSLQRVRQGGLLPWPVGALGNELLQSWQHSSRCLHSSVGVLYQDITFKELGQGSITAHRVHVVEQQRARAQPVQDTLLRAAAK